MQFQQEVKKNNLHEQSYQCMNKECDSAARVSLNCHNGRVLNVAYGTRASISSGMVALSAMKGLVDLFSSKG